MLRIRPGEGRIAGRLLAMMFTALAGAAIGANAVESLLFSRYGPHVLPYLYVILGVVTFGAMMAMSALLGRPDPTRRLAAAVLGLAGGLVTARGILFLGFHWFYPVLWVVMMIVWTTQVMACWAVAGAVNDTRQAKRLFPLYGSGLIVGGVVGGLATGPLAAWLGAENLLLVWAGALGATFALIRSVSAPGRVVRRQRRRGRGRGLLREMAEGFRRTRETTLLRWMSVSLILFALLYFTLALRFAETATTRFPRTEDLAGFLGLFMGLSNGAALLVSLVVANRLFARFGVPAMVLALAVIYLVGFTVLAVTSGFAALVAFRFIQMVWVNGVWATGWQALFNVVPADSRARVRSFMDGGPLQAGIVLSGLLLILAERVLGPRELHIAGVAAAILAVWAMWRARAAYSGALVEALRVGNPDVFRSEEEPFGGMQRDAEAQTAVMAGASDPDPIVRRVSVEILAELEAPGAVEALQGVLADTDPEVRAAALRGLAGAGDPSVAPSIALLLQDAEPPVRSGAVAALVSVLSEGGDIEAVLLPLLSDPDPEVRATAAGALVRASDGRGRRALLDMSGSPSPEWRRVALLRLAEAGLEAELVVAGLSDPDPSVRRDAASAVAMLASDRSVDPLIEALGDHDPGVREAASGALVRLGPAVTGRVVEALSRPDLEAAALSTLSRLPTTEPDVFRAYAREQVTQAKRYHELWRRVRGDADQRLALLAGSVRDRALGHAINAVRAISPLGDRAAMELAVENLQSHDAQQRANALETLEAVGEPELVRPLLAVWEGHAEPRSDGRSVIVELLGDEDPWLRACAVFAAATIADGRLGPTLEEMARSDGEQLVREVAASTIAEGERKVETLSTLSTMERVLFLRKVRLFSELPPPDLKQIAEIATEHVYPDGGVIAEQGEAGDEMHIVVSGEIRVMLARDGRADEEVARRTPGDYVGEMAIISEEPRMASLVGSGEVRTMGIDRRRFERILRDRPETSLAVMRVLCERLKESHAHQPIEARI